MAIDLISALSATGNEDDYLVALDICEQEGWALDFGTSFYWPWTMSYLSSDTGYHARSAIEDIPGRDFNWRSVFETTCSIVEPYVFSYVMNTRSSLLTFNRYK